MKYALALLAAVLGFSALPSTAEARTVVYVSTHHYSHSDRVWIRGHYVWRHHHRVFIPGHWSR